MLTVAPCKLIQAGSSLPLVDGEGFYEEVTFERKPQIKGGTEQCRSMGE